MATTLLTTILTTNGLIPIARVRNTNATNATNVTTNTTTITTNQMSSASSSNKIFYLFTAEYEGFNETKSGIPADTFLPDVLIVNERDNVTIQFYNLEQQIDIHLRLEHHIT